MFKDRIKEFRRIKASEIRKNPHNWRKHPEHQQEAVYGILSELGMIDALIVYESEREGGITLVDGELRKGLDPDAEWPCVVLDLNDDEADYALTTLDWPTYEAEADRVKLKALLEGIETGYPEVQASLDRMAEHFGAMAPHFSPTSIDDQGQLDKTKTMTCPECGHEFQA